MLEPADQRAAAVAAWAESGTAWLTGSPDAAPLVPPGTAALVARGWTDHLSRASEHASLPDGAVLLGERAALTGLARRGTVSPGGGTRLVRAADGLVAISSARPDDPLLLAALVGVDLDERLESRVDDWVADHPAAEVERRASELGLAVAQVRRDRVGALPAGGAPRSVQGMLVVDFSALWAGPLCAHLLSLCGAQVVKVETPDRPDGARRGDRAFYDLLHGTHESVVLDPVADRARLHSLVARADVVIEASRPRALANWGLDAEEHVGLGTTWVSITADGRSSTRVGFGDDVAAGAGLVTHDPDHPDAGPYFSGDAIADPLTGLAAAAAVATEPDTSHGGRLVDLSMTAVVASTLNERPDGWARTESGRDGPHAVDETGQRHPIARPRARTPRTSAPASGHDTRAVLTRLGIR